MNFLMLIVVNISVPSSLSVIVGVFQTTFVDYLLFYWFLVQQRKQVKLSLQCVALEWDYPCIFVFRPFALSFFYLVIFLEDDNLVIWSEVQLRAGEFSVLGVVFAHSALENFELVSN